MTLKNCPKCGGRMIEDYFRAPLRCMNCNYKDKQLTLGFEKKDESVGIIVGGECY